VQPDDDAKRHLLDALNRARQRLGVKPELSASGSNGR
jgi:hypothetical protein